MITAAGYQIKNGSAAVNLLNFERVQNWTRLNYFIKHQIQNVNTRKYSDLLHLWTGKNSTVQDWTQRTVYRIIRNRNKLRFAQK